MNNLDVKKLVTMALLIALSYVGSLLTIGGGSIAFDSLAGFFGALALGPLYGGIIGLIGHLFTAALRSFYLGLPLHLIVSITMFISCAGFGMVYKISTRKSSKVFGILVGILLNGPVALGASALFVAMSAGKEAGTGLFVALIVPLLIGAALNVIMAAVLYEFTKDQIKYL